jgi:hypothetical protein
MGTDENHRNHRETADFADYTDLNHGEPQRIKNQESKREPRIYTDRHGLKNTLGYGGGGKDGLRRGFGGKFWGWDKTGKSI